MKLFFTCMLLFCLNAGAEVKPNKGEKAYIKMPVALAFLISQHINEIYLRMI